MSFIKLQGVTFTTLLIGPFLFHSHFSRSLPPLAVSELSIAFTFMNTKVLRTTYCPCLVSFTGEEIDVHTWFHENAHVNSFINDFVLDISILSQLEIFRLKAMLGKFFLINYFHFLKGKGENCRIIGFFEILFVPLVNMRDYYRVIKYDNCAISVLSISSKVKTVSFECAFF